MRSACLSVCVLFACATTTEQAPPLLAPAQIRPAPAAFDARAFAQDQFSAGECETAARHLRKENPDQAWSALRGCIDRSRWPRGEFTHLDRLTGGFWDEDLQTRPDAPLLISKVIALRGGDVEGDIPLAQKSRVPLFTLAAAMKQPNTYKGRLVVLRASLGEVLQDGGKASATLRETSLRATAHEEDVSPTYRHSVSARGDIAVTDRSGTTTQMKDGARLQSESSAFVRRFDNERTETGRSVVARLPQADPFLEPGKDFIFIGRFDGMRPGSQDDAPLAVITMSAYFAPNALMLQ